MPVQSITMSPIDTVRSLISPKLKFQRSGESSKPRILVNCLKQYFNVGSRSVKDFSTAQRKNSEDLFGWPIEEEDNDPLLNDSNGN